MSVLDHEKRHSNGSVFACRNLQIKHKTAILSANPHRLQDKHEFCHELDRVTGQYLGKRLCQLLFKGIPSAAF